MKDGKFVHDLHSIISNEEIILQGFSTNFEADASELIENLERLFYRYYMESYVISRVKFSITHWCVIRRERVLISAFLVFFSHNNRVHTHIMYVFILLLQAECLWFVEFLSLFSWYFMTLYIHELFCCQL